MRGEQVKKSGKDRKREPIFQHTCPTEKVSLFFVTLAVGYTGLGIAQHHSLKDMLRRPQLNHCVGETMNLLE
jgi:hypothetical protein